jgi:rod shape-determining protein MreD
MRYLVLLLLGYALLVLEGALMVLVPVPAAGPDLALLVVVAAALSRRGTAPVHALFALAMGYLADVLGGGPRGLLAFSFALMSLVGRSFSRRVYVNRLWGRAVAAVVCTALCGTTATFVQWLVVEGATLRPLGLVPLHAGVTALLAAPIIALCRRIDSALGIVMQEPLRW